MRLHRPSPARRPALDQLGEALDLPVARVDEVEGAPVEVGADHDRRDLQPHGAAREWERERRRLPGAEPGARADLDAAGAEINRRRVPFRPVALVHSQRQRDRGARGAASLGRWPGAGRRPPARAEAPEHLFQALERHGLAEEVERPEREALLSLALRHPSRDHHDRHAQLADRLEPEEVEPAHPGQVDVEEDDVGGLGQQHVERGLGRVHDARLVADLREELLEDLAEVLVILDD